MYKLAWSQSFKRGYKKAVRSNPHLEQKNHDMLEFLCKEPFDSRLRSHKLYGKLDGLWACRVEHDCRIVFAFDKDPQTGDQLIALIDVGKHDEVY
ncbi:type II toxin-antitoxin system mRNA interferase toxin, RelE/StbE family [Desulfonatronum sp. SC1]|uniref:type II toxin-antitoxin system RelE/ParE family toxin n=1 Tax=Desulfonatronum sp. SC1 TaxID=2109626 RepID=UPI000D30DCA7|nr:type II toxin-antitoxin system mRNA interferase toxin, RelE/StbE family [Desulfonatronum sp. SC1]PTN33793.1 type II toxin-antitoxin system mRNA interferase toxin, RelE/StbE family [Desulfonatronum sp. SC1]